MDRWFRPLLLLGVLLNLSGLTTVLMEPDAALYASVARRMAEHGDAVNLLSQGRDWLDKPHFPFWMTALAFRLFGVGTAVYKLPGLVFWAVGVVYTYLFALRFYSRAVARLAVLLLLSAQHLVMSNNDVRAEPYLLGLVMGGLYHFTRAQAHRFSLHLVWGAAWAACAVMTKGLFVLIPIAGGLAFHWIRRRDGSQFWHPRWWLALLLVGVFTAPELYCLHQQFDLHPEKEVFGQVGVSGLRFFFWDSQFGRFFNTGPIQGKGSPFFFLHTVLWAFLPWSLWFYAAVVGALRRSASSERPGEDYTLGAALLTLLVFSLSRFQLPHYTNVLFPFFCVITAAWLDRLSEGQARQAARVQGVVVAAMLLLLPVLLWTVAPEGLRDGSLALGAAVALTLPGWSRADLPGAVGKSFGACVALNLVLNVLVYPRLLDYQAGDKAAVFLNGLPSRPTGLYGFNSFALDFYARAPIERWSLSDLQARAGPVYVVLEARAVPELTEAGLRVQPLRAFKDYRVTRLTGRFLNPATRDEATREVLVALVSSAPLAGVR